MATRFIPGQAVVVAQGRRFEVHCELIDFETDGSHFEIVLHGPYVGARTLLATVSDVESVAIDRWRSAIVDLVRDEAPGQAAEVTIESWPKMHSEP